MTYRTFNTVDKEMCFWIFKKKNEYEKNSKKYIENKFRFLLDKGYRYKYFFKNGEESFCFEKDNHLIDIEHIGYPFGLNIVVYSRAFSVGKISCDKNVLEWKNINEVLDIDKEKFKNLSPIQVIDDYAEIIENHFDEIENAL